MSGAVESAGTRNPWLTAAAWRALFRDRPIIPLLGLLAILVILRELARPGVFSADFTGTVLRAAVPLAILAGCQTLTMLTGGIDLSVGAVASMSGFVVATVVGGQGLAVAIAGGARDLGTGRRADRDRGRGLPGPPADHDPGHGTGRPRAGQRLAAGDGADRSGRPARDADARVRTGCSGSCPYSLIIFVPLAALILLALRRTGYGRLLYAIGDNPIAARLSGARAWRVLVVLYIISALLAGVAGLLISGLTNVASVTLADSYVLPVGRRGSHRRDVDPRRPGRLRRDDRRRADPDGAHLAPLDARVPGGCPPGPLRGDHRRRRGALHAGHRRDLMDAHPLGTATSVGGRLVLDDRVASGRISIEDGVIVDVALDDAVDAGDPYIAPGFVDVHVHGWGGHDAMGGLADLDGMARSLLRHGVTSFLPTAVTAPLGTLVAFAEQVRAWTPAAPADGAEPLGFNLEGPFLAPARHGAHDPALLLTPADVPVGELEPLVDGLRLLTVAPELPGALELIRWLRSRGAAVSIGHSAATVEEARAGYDAGATSTTHLFNAMSGIDHRAPGLAVTALLDDARLRRAHRRRRARRSARCGRSSRGSSRSSGSCS